eukprot:m.46770 g.46770  ORF g.46770 m.46770 type:complete len:856 (-) comp8798_c0_seq1:193-2760(-)
MPIFQAESIRCDFPIEILCKKSELPIAEKRVKIFSRALPRFERTSPQPLCSAAQRDPRCVLRARMVDQVALKRKCRLRVLHIPGNGANIEEKERRLENIFRKVKVFRHQKGKDFSWAREQIGRVVNEFRPDVVTAHAAGAGKILSVIKAEGWVGPIVLMNPGVAVAGLDALAQEVPVQAITVVVPANCATADDQLAALDGCKGRRLNGVSSIEIDDGHALDEMLDDEALFRKVVEGTFNRHVRLVNRHAREESLRKEREASLARRKSLTMTGGSVSWTIDTNDLKELQERNRRRRESLTSTSSSSLSLKSSLNSSFSSFSDGDHDTFSLSNFSRQSSVASRRDSTQLFRTASTVSRHSTAGADVDADGVTLGLRSLVDIIPEVPAAEGAPLAAETDEDGSPVVDTAVDSADPTPASTTVDTAAAPATPAVSQAESTPTATTGHSAAAPRPPTPARSPGRARRVPLGPKADGLSHEGSPTISVLLDRASGKKYGFKTTGSGTAVGGTGITVSRLSEKGQAATTGKIAVGDLLVSVNGVKASHLTRDGLARVISQSTKLALTLKHSVGGAPVNRRPSTSPAPTRCPTPCERQRKKASSTSTRRASLQPSASTGAKGEKRSTGTLSRHSTSRLSQTLPSRTSTKRASAATTKSSKTRTLPNRRKPKEAGVPVSAIGGSTAPVSVRRKSHAPTPIKPAVLADSAEPAQLPLQDALIETPAGLDLAEPHTPITSGVMFDLGIPSCPSTPGTPGSVIESVCDVRIASGAHPRGNLVIDAFECSSVSSATSTETEGDENALGTTSNIPAPIARRGKAKAKGGVEAARRRSSGSPEWTAATSSTRRTIPRAGVSTRRKMSCDV